MIPLYFSLSGAFLAGIHYLFTFETLYAFKKNIVGRQLYTFLNRKWFFDKVYNEWISQTVLNIAYKNSYQAIDRGLLEFMGPTGLSIVLNNLAKDLQKINLSMLFSRLYPMIVFLFFCFLKIQVLDVWMPDFTAKFFYFFLIIILRIAFFSGEIFLK